MCKNSGESVDHLLLHYKLVEYGFRLVWCSVGYAFRNIRYASFLARLVWVPLE